VIRGQSRVPTSNIPWNAPELETESAEVEVDELLDMDLYSLGLLCVHIILPLSLLEKAGLCFVRQRHIMDDAWEKVVQELEKAKAQTAEDETLGFHLTTIISEADIEVNLKQLLVLIVRDTISAPKKMRKMPWADIFKLMSAHVSEGLVAQFYECFLFLNLYPL
jgi:hypothetical protein